MNGFEIWGGSILAAAATLLSGALLAPFCAVLADTGSRLGAGEPWPRVLHAAAIRLPAALDDWHRLVRRPARRDGDAAPSAGLLSVALAATALALVPGLAAGPGLLSVADLPTLLVLLALSRLAALAATGDGMASLRGHALLVRMGLAAAGTALVMLAVFGAAGALGTAPLLAVLAANPNAAIGALLALALVASLLAAADPVPDGPSSGSDLAVIRAATALRGVGFVALATALLCPATVATPDWTAGHWLLAILAWPIRLLVGALLAGLLQQAASRLPDRRSLLVVSLICALLAVLLAAPELQAVE